MVNGHLRLDNFSINMSTIDTFPMLSGRPPSDKTIRSDFKPKIISYYSVTWDEEKKRRDFDNDDRANLRVLLPYSNTTFFVHAGYDGIKEGQSFLPSPNKPPLARLLMHLTEGRGRGIKFDRKHGDTRPIPYDFVTKRKVLYRIMVLSQNSTNCEDQLEMFAQKYKDTIYLAYNTNELEMQRFMARSDEANRGSYAGLKFKDLLTKFAYWPKGDAHDFRRLKDTFNCVFSGNFGGVRVLYAGGMDTVHNKRCLEDDVSDNQSVCSGVSSRRSLPEGTWLDGGDFVQIKTVSAKFKGKPGQLRMKKYRFWWAKCWLSGSHGLIYGYLTERGNEKIIDKVEYVTTRTMTKDIGERPEVADEIDASGDVNESGLVDHRLENWVHFKQSTSIARLTFFLKFLKNKMKDAKEDELYNIQWKRGNRYYTITKVPIKDADASKVIIRDHFKAKFH